MTGRGKPGGSATPVAPTSSTPPSKPTGMSLAAALEKRMQSTSQRSTRVTHAHLPSTAGEHSLSGWVVTVLAGAANAAHPAIHAVGVQSDRVHILGDDGTIRAVSDRCNVVLNIISVVMDNSRRYHVPHHITITNLHGGVNQQFNPAVGANLATSPRSVVVLTAPPNMVPSLRVPINFLTPLHAVFNENLIVIPPRLPAAAADPALPAIAEDAGAVGATAGAAAAADAAPAAIAGAMLQPPAGDDDGDLQLEDVPIFYAGLLNALVRRPSVTAQIVLSLRTPTSRRAILNKLREPTAGRRALFLMAAQNRGSATPVAPTSSTPPSKPTGMSLAAALEKRMQSTSQRSTRVTHAHLPSTAGEHSLSGWVVTVLAGAANAAHPAIHAVGVQSDRVHILGDDGTIRAVSDRCNVVLNVISVVMDNSRRYHVPHHITITNLHGGVNQQFNPAVGANLATSPRSVVVLTAPPNTVPSLRVPINFLTPLHAVFNENLIVIPPRLPAAAADPALPAIAEDAGAAGATAGAAAAADAAPATIAGAMLQPPAGDDDGDLQLEDVPIFYAGLLNALVRRPSVTVQIVLSLRTPTSRRAILNKLREPTAGRRALFLMAAQNRGEEITATMETGIMGVTPDTPLLIHILVELLVHDQNMLTLNSNIDQAAFTSHAPVYGAFMPVVLDNNNLIGYLLSAALAAYDGTLVTMPPDVARVVYGAQLDAVLAWAAQSAGYEPQHARIGRWTIAGATVQAQLP
ncbi:hypothetical protein CHLRE_17g734773v5 [Chlamydomonas reinhardtii]|uniref:Uncharacterized protein n=1 Tax=Chlamydomonas reinhardtii TaxID=3055 RepID=A0A2K3CRB1_CHLRE|nr:uncharacterized protein CHLRE_17g734773v5 [Chlamydomonas reinhardtii]PNW70818.1 hypothetical protein CHLRE_17g734773v5 [Chlamydomonas reinhardtii]